jgi:hypothetical protein
MKRSYFEGRHNHLCKPAQGSACQRQLQSGSKIPTSRLPPISTSYTFVFPPDALCVLYRFLYRLKWPD